MSRIVRSLLLPELRDEAGETGRLLRVHSCRRLVEQRSGSVASARATSSEALVTVGQVLRVFTRAPPQARELEQVERPVARARLLTAQASVRMMEAQTPPLMRLCIATMTFSSAVMLWKRRMFWMARHQGE